MVDPEASARFLLMALLFFEALLFGAPSAPLPLASAAARVDTAPCPCAPLPWPLAHGRVDGSDAPASLRAAGAGLFTLAMLTEQLGSIVADQTGIERLKQDYVSQNRGWLFNMSETFGRPLSLLWLLPTTVKYNGLTWIDMLPQECEV